MKKIIAIIIVGVFLLSGLGAVAVSEVDEKLVMENQIKLSKPIIKDNGMYVSVDLEESTSMLLDVGKPALPVVANVCTFPINTKIDDVVVTFSDIVQYDLSKKITPSPKPILLLPEIMKSQSNQVNIIDEEIYSSSDLYPKEQYIIGKSVGLKGDEHVIYVSIQCYPVQYSPAKDTISVAGSVDISISYTLPSNPVKFGDSYDLLIITPEDFETGLQPLVDHKNNNGVNTVVKTVEDIYAEYDGRDEPEDIKLFIHDAIDEDGLNWGIDYVLLFGGRKGQSQGWYIPERISNCDDDSDFEVGYATDLYYADIYKIVENETVFDDWDSNGNNIFAEFYGFNKDVIDYNPDVKLGRIPVRYSFQVGFIVDKIIEYETSADDSWFKKALLISGDTSPPARGPVTPGVYEGELSTGITGELLEDIGFTVEKLWTSEGTFTGPNDIITAINAGAGMIHFAGHGNPAFWGNFEPDAETEEGMVDGLGLKHIFFRLRNGEKLPVVVVGGCHNAQFNTTMMNIITDIREYGFMSYFGLWPNATKNSYRFYYKEWVPTCWASMFLMKKSGGSIATIGNTGLGWGYINQGVTTGLGGWINPRFFDCYANQSLDVLGDAHSQAIADYITYVGGVNTKAHDRKTIEEWALLGDPSLKIGGI